MRSVRSAGTEADGLTAPATRSDRCAPRATHGSPRNSGQDTRPASAVNTPAAAVIVTALPAWVAGSSRASIVSAIAATEPGTSPYQPTTP